MRKIPFILVAAALCGATLSSQTSTPARSQTAQPPRPAAAASRETLRAGFSVERLGRIDALLQRYVDENRVAGAVALVLRNGQPVYERAVGWADKEAGRKMTTDTIFRIASQTKAITSAAVLVLVEEGRIGLNDPVSRFIPAYAKTTVSVRGESGAVTAEPARRPITIFDLLTHTAGISYGREPEIASLYQPKGLGPAAASGGTPPTRASRSATPWSVWPRFRSRHTPASGGCTATTPTSWAASWRRHPARRSTYSCGRASSSRSTCATRASS